MKNRRRPIAVAVGALALATWAMTVDAGAGDGGAGCHGLSPASAQGCTSEQLRSAFERER